MQIVQVVSYLGAWKKLQKEFLGELNEIIAAATNYYSGKVKLDEGEERPGGNIRALWGKALYDFSWTINDQTYFSPAGRRVHLGSLGPTKNGISVQINFGNPTWFHRWLFSQGSLAVRYAGVKIPILVAPMREFERREERRSMQLSHFEYLRDQLETLAPLSSTFPFLILGVTDQPSLTGVGVFEIPSDPNITTERVVVDRCIEFPPEYHQAGLSILNYFGVFLRENYPERDAKVKIEQHGLSVRMIVETSDGDMEVVEKALHDYELVMSGKVQPEAISQNDKVVLDLKNELRITQVRLESQQDIISVQNRRIDTLLTVIGNSLEASSRRPITIEVSPSFQNSLSVNVNQDISAALSGVYDLIDSVAPSDETHMVLSDLAGSLEAVKKETNPEKVKNSPAMSKLRRLFDRVSSGNDAISVAISNIEKGKEMVTDLAKTYNKIAGWCGLPNIPFV
jgi:hypothetical protein